MKYQLVQLFAENSTDLQFKGTKIMLRQTHTNSDTLIFGWSIDVLTYPAGVKAEVSIKNKIWRFSQLMLKKYVPTKQAHK